MAPLASTQTLPWVRRGDDVQAAYSAFLERLGRFHARLHRVIDLEAPDLAARLQPPAPIMYGYQLVPKLLPLLPGRRAAVPAVSVSYSWTRTQSIIDNEVARLTASERDLDALAAVAEPARRAALEKLVGNYQVIERNQRTADQHLKHNWLWQREIAEHPERFTRLAELHDVVIERQKLLATSRDQTQAAEARSAAIARAEALNAVIAQAQPPPILPPFARLTEPAPGQYVVRVPLYTDIIDHDFLEAAERAIEDVWRIETAGRRFSVDVEIRPVAPDTLYERNGVPARGAHIDLAAHVARFPRDGGVLTTGASRTIAIPGRYVALAPVEILANSLAHEFGHILGFTDRYFRGGRDRGDAGYEILEIVPDTADIMAAPGEGRVLAGHVEQIVAASPR